MESRCAVIGISVAESCGIRGTWPDSYSMLLSSRLPARPQRRPSVWVTLHAQTVTAMIYSMFDRLYDCRQGNCFSWENQSCCDTSQLYLYCTKSQQFSLYSTHKGCIFVSVKSDWKSNWKIFLTGYMKIRCMAVVVLFSIKLLIICHRTPC